MRNGFWKHLVLHKRFDWPRLNFLCLTGVSTVTPNLTRRFRRTTVVQQGPIVRSSVVIEL